MISMAPSSGRLKAYRSSTSTQIRTPAATRTAMAIAPNTFSHRTSRRSSGCSHSSMLISVAGQAAQLRNLAGSALLQRLPFNLIGGVEVALVLVSGELHLLHLGADCLPFAFVLVVEVLDH